jgi:hypothetical protein
MAVWGGVVQNSSLIPPGTARSVKFLRPRKIKLDRQGVTPTNEIMLEITY